MKKTLNQPSHTETTPISDTVQDHLNATTAASAETLENLEQKTLHDPATIDSQVALQIFNLNKSFGKRQVIHNLSLEIRRGEVLGFLGPNGAGKTTVLKMLTGFLTPDSGDIYVDGMHHRKHFTQVMQRIGAVVEQPEMYKEFSAYNNLKLYARLHKGVTKERIQTVITQLRLENRIKDKVKRYSLGMKQRLGLAQAMLHNPDILLLDEPTNGLDPAGIHELRNILIDLAHKENKAILVSSHLLSEMQLMCDRVAIIKEGHLIGVEEMHERSANTRLSLSIKAKPYETLIERLLPYHPDLIQKGDTVDIQIEEAHIPELIRYLSRNGCDLYEIKQEQQSLESLFLEITGGGQTIA